MAKNPLKVQLRTKLNGMKRVLVKSWNERERINENPKLTGGEKKQRRKASREKLEKKLADKKQGIKKMLRKNKLDETEIPEEEPKNTSKAVQYQNRARSRFRELDDSTEILQALDDEINDAQKPKDYKKAAFRTAKTRLEAMGEVDGQYTEPQLKKLREKILPEDKRQQLQLTRVIEDVEPTVTFTANYISNQVSQVFPKPKKKGNPTLPSTQDQLKEQLGNIYDKAMDSISETVEKHKTIENQRQGK